MAVFVMGRPGAGKDTQAEFLASRFNLEHIITSALIQKKFREATDDPKVKKEKAIFDSGTLNTPAWVVSVINERVAELAKNNFEGKNGIVFSGSPRTEFEAEEEFPFFVRIFGREHMFVFYLDIPEEEGVKRILKRAARELDRHPETIKVRMHQYDKRTQPVLDYFEKISILERIDGMPGIEEISQNIQNILKEKL